MKEINYTPSLTGLTIVTDPDRQRDLVFGNGHPNFLIPDFDPEPTDIWLSYEDYIEKTKGTIYDQNGGEVLSYTPIGNSGLMKVEYVLYDISLESDPNNYQEYNLTIEGYVIDGDVLQSTGYFLATKISGDI